VREIGCEIESHRHKTHEFSSEKMMKNDMKMGRAMV
jgi:hypothetical protein